MAFLFVVFVADDSEAATYKVDSLGGSDYTNITQAVENASAGDTINIASRNYFDAVDVDKRLTITGGNYGVNLNNLYSYCYENDLIGYYQFDNSGTYVSDRVWCENNYGYLSGAVRTPGFTGDYSVDFDGDDDYLAIDHDSVYNVSKVSISGWINIDDNETSDSVIFSNYNSGDHAGYALSVTSDGKLEFKFGFGTNSGGCTSDEGIPENKWTLVTATYSSSIKLYINDELVKTCNYGEDMQSGTNEQVFGASDENADSSYADFFDGTIDDLLIWKKALNPKRTARAPQRRVTTTKK